MPEVKNYFVHESSYIDDNVEIGEGTKIWHFCHILKFNKFLRKERIVWKLETLV